MQHIKQALIVRANYQQYIAQCENEMYTMQVSGRFHYNVCSKEDYPVVGDLVWFVPTNLKEGIIERVETRKSVIKRLARTSEHNAQVLASNVDIAFLCLSCNQDFHIKKVENLLNLTYGENIEQVVLLTKSDLTNDIEEYHRQVRQITDGLILPVSIHDDKSMSQLQALIEKKTCVLIGSSGVGKSTIINTLMGYKVVDTQEIRQTDDQGRHTTTHRELIELPTGGKIIDTPGMRELDAYIIEDIDRHFEDIAAIASDCRFRDCTHTNEPGCMVVEAMDTGELSMERIKQYKRAKRHTAYAKKKDAEKERLRNKKQYR
jgi:ribosome biogenesis GTPase